MSSRQFLMSKVSSHGTKHFHVEIVILIFYIRIVGYGSVSETTFYPKNYCSIFYHLHIKYNYILFILYKEKLKKKNSRGRKITLE